MSTPLRRIARNFGLATFGQFATTGLGFIVLTLNSRALGANDLGRLFLVLAVCELISGLIGFQNWQAFAKVGAEIERRGSLTRLWLYGACLDLLAALIAGVVTAGLLLWTPGLVGLEPDVAKLGLMYAACLVMTATGTSVGALRLLDAFSWTVYVSVLQSGFLLASAALLYAVEAPLAMYFLSISVVTAFCGLLMNALGFLRVYSLDVVRPSPRVDRVIRRRFLRFALGTSASGALTILRQRGEILIVGAILGPTAAGLYGVAYRLASLAVRLANSASVSVYPEFSRMVARGEFEVAVRVAFRLAFWTGAAGLIALLVVAAFGDEILAVMFGDEYRAASSILLLLTIGMALYNCVAALSPLVQIAFGSWRYFSLNLLAFGGFAGFAVIGPALFGLSGAGAGELAFCVLYAALLVYQVSIHVNNKSRFVS